MTKIKYKKFFLLLLILVLGFFIVFQNQSTLIRFFLVVWIVGMAFKLVSEEPIKQVLPVDLSKMKLYESDGKKTTEDIISNMEEDGYRPATLVETLVWNKAYPNTHNKITLIALGSSQIKDKIRSVPGIAVYKNEGPDFYSDLSGNEWEGEFRFLGVPKSS